jgi:hypothetical protein
MNSLSVFKNAGTLLEANKENSLEVNENENWMKINESM